MEPTKLKRIGYQDLNRLEIERFHARVEADGSGGSGISLVDMGLMQAAHNPDGSVDFEKMPDIPLERLDNTLLWLAVCRVKLGASRSEALGGMWEWEDAPVEDVDGPKGGAASSETGS